MSADKANRREFGVHLTPIEIFDEFIYPAIKDHLNNKEAFMKYTMPKSEMLMKLLQLTLNAGYRDVLRLIEFMKFAEKLEISTDDIADFVDEFKDSTMTIDINTWLFAYCSKITDKLCELVEENTDSQEIKDLVNSIRENNNPYINWMDTWLDNLFDELNMYKLKNKEEIIKAAVELCKKEVSNKINTK